MDAGPGTLLPRHLFFKPSLCPPLGSLRQVSYFIGRLASLLHSTIKRLRGCKSYSGSADQTLAIAGYQGLFFAACNLVCSQRTCGAIGKPYLLSKETAPFFRPVDICVYGGGPVLVLEQAFCFDLFKNIVHVFGLSCACRTPHMRRDVPHQAPATLSTIAHGVRSRVFKTAHRKRGENRPSWICYDENP